MRTLVLTSLFVLAGAAAFVPASNAAHVNCATPGVVCISGSVIDGWNPPVVFASPDTWIVWRSGDGMRHPAQVLLSQMHQQSDGQSSWQVQPGAWIFRCTNHPNMVGTISQPIDLAS